MHASASSLSFPHPAHTSCCCFRWRVSESESETKDLAFVFLCANTHAHSEQRREKGSRESRLGKQSRGEFSRRNREEGRGGEKERRRRAAQEQLFSFTRHASCVCSFISNCLPSFHRHPRCILAMPDSAPESGTLSLTSTGTRANTRRKQRRSAQQAHQGRREEQRQAIAVSKVSGNHCPLSSLLPFLSSIFDLHVHFDLLWHWLQLEAEREERKELAMVAASSATGIGGRVASHAITREQLARTHTPIP